VKVEDSSVLTPRGGFHDGLRFWRNSWGRAPSSLVLR